MKKLILKLLGFTTEEIYLFESIKAARSIQDFYGAIITYPCVVTMCDDKKKLKD